MSIAINDSSGNLNENDTTTNNLITVLDILNWDCVFHIFSFIPYPDLIRSERVSLQWRSMVKEYLELCHCYKMSWCMGLTETSTSTDECLLRCFKSRSTTVSMLPLQILPKLDSTIKQLYVDWNLNLNSYFVYNQDFPNLEVLVIYSNILMNFYHWFLGSKKLKSISLIATEGTDMFLMELIGDISSLESLTLIRESCDGSFLSLKNLENIKRLTFDKCFILKDFYLKNVENFQNLISLKLDHCPLNLWKTIVGIISSLPQLQELSLCGDQIQCYNPSLFEEQVYEVTVKQFCQCISKLSSLKHLNLSQNIFATNDVMKQIAESCKLLDTLNISKLIESFPMISDEGVMVVCMHCENLQSLNVSYQSELSAHGVAAASGVKQLARLSVRGLPALDAASLTECLLACPALIEIDARDCCNVTTNVVHDIIAALQQQPRPLLLHLTGTDVKNELPRHKLLTVNAVEFSTQQTLSISPEEFLKNLYISTNYLQFQEVLSLYEDFE